MKELIVTVAGTATRFNRDTDKNTLKCLYYHEMPEYSLLYQILDRSRCLDKFVIVGGYLYDDLCEFVEKYLSEFKDKIDLVYNLHYNDYGSGYSLIKGIEALSIDCKEVVFVEGDLFFDASSFDRILATPRNVITVNREFITSQKAVALYVDLKGYIHYLYDTKHETLNIKEPFQAIYNSGQIWKFLSLDKIRSFIENMTPSQVQGTNLELIQGYFGDVLMKELEVVPMEVWFNCNTVADYKQVFSLINK